MNADEVRKRLEAAIAAKGTNASKLSLEMGRSVGYLSDFLKGRKNSIGAAEVAELEVRLRLEPGYFTRPGGTISAPDTDRISICRPVPIEAAAARLGVDPEKLRRAREDIPLAERLDAELVARGYAESERHEVIDALYDALEKHGTHDP